MQVKLNSRISNADTDKAHLKIRKGSLFYARHVEAARVTCMPETLEGGESPKHVGVTNPTIRVQFASGLQAG